jgi:hypothetical protein
MLLCNDRLARRRYLDRNWKCIRGHSGSCTYWSVIIQMFRYCLHIISTSFCPVRASYDFFCALGRACLKTSMAPNVGSHRSTCITHSQHALVKLRSFLHIVSKVRSTANRTSAKLVGLVLGNSYPTSPGVAINRDRKLTNPAGNPTGKPRKCFCGVLASNAISRRVLALHVPKRKQPMDFAERVSFRGRCVLKVRTLQPLHHCSQYTFILSLLQAMTAISLNFQTLSTHNRQHVENPRPRKSRTGSCTTPRRRAP